MKFDFDTYEFAALVAPGSVAIIAIVLFDPGLLRVAEPTLVIGAAIVAAYVFGHLIAALGNLTQPLFAGSVRRG